ncbi:hypothetical protein [Embleya sp. NBC_00896]|uniref:hypothetical protein n=1 Tax=Embleya sp. NBC_00896 TaxID=2975961 RepID=UPI00386E79B7|nr:hypothetical protein OG928_06420 [Embleya sp. NBC_00896]
MTGIHRSTEVPYRASWVPIAGHSLVVAGLHFDAVKIAGELAIHIADALIDARDGAPVGPIVHEVFRRGLTYFLVPPGAARVLRWPPGIEVLDRTRSAHVGIPALWGNTWPLCWRSVPTSDARLVEVEPLHRLACAETGFTPTPIPRG